MFDQRPVDSQPQLHAANPTFAVRSSTSDPLALKRHPRWSIMLQPVTRLTRAFSDPGSSPPLLPAPHGDEADVELLERVRTLLPAMSEMLIRECMIEQDDPQRHAATKNTTAINTIIADVTTCYSSDDDNRA